MLYNWVYHNSPIFGGASSFWFRMIFWGVYGNPTRQAWRTKHTKHPQELDHWSRFFGSMVHIEKDNGDIW
jgi:hypothetical protein